MLGQAPCGGASVLRMRPDWAMPSSSARVQLLHAAHTLGRGTLARCHCLYILYRAVPSHQAVCPTVLSLRGTACLRLTGARTQPSPQIVRKQAHYHMLSIISMLRSA